MSRFNWMIAATWAVPIVCLIIAFYAGFAKWNEWSQTVRDYEANEQKKGTVIMTRESLKKELPGANRLTAAQDKYEPYHYYSELQQLVRDAHVRLISAQNNTSLTPLYDLKGAAAANANQNGANGSNGSSGQNTPPVAPLNKLPLNATAITQTIVVKGPYPNVRRFLYLVRRFRYRGRAFNINDAVLSDLDAKTGEMLATMNLTRFVRPEEPGAANSVSALGGEMTSPSPAGSPSASAGNAATATAGTTGGAPPPDTGKQNITSDSLDKFHAKQPKTPAQGVVSP